MVVFSLADAAALLLADFTSAFVESLDRYDAPVEWICDELEQTLEVRATQGAGHGLFASAGLPAGCVLGEYGGLLTPDAPRIVGEAPPVASPYSVTYPALGADGRGLAVDAAAMGSLLRRINHGDGQQVNCTFAYGWYGRPGDAPVRITCAADALPFGPPRIFLLTTRPVPRGAQLLANYGVEYWRKQGVRPVDWGAVQG